MRFGLNNLFLNECVSGGKRIRIKVNITKFFIMAYYFRYKRKRRCLFFMKMYCNNVVSKLLLV